MTGDIFKIILIAMDKDMTSKRRKVLLFIDNCSANGLIEDMQKKLKSIRLAYFPANTTSHLQPLDQGNINSLKVHYRSKMLSMVVSRLDTNKIVSPINLLEAINLFSHSWNVLVSSVTVAKCFDKAGFQKERKIQNELFEGDIATVISSMDATYQSYVRRTNMAETPEIRDFMFRKDAVVVTEQVSDDDIVLTVSQESIIDDDESSDDEAPEVPHASKEKNGCFIGGSTKIFVAGGTSISMTSTL